MQCNQKQTGTVMSASQETGDPPECLSAKPEQLVCESYRFFDIPVSSQIPVPELPRCAVSEPALTVRLGVHSPFDPADFEIRHDWHDGEDRLICRCSRRGSDYLLSLPQQSHFHIAADGVITCIPTPQTTPSWLRQMLLNQVLPRYFAHTGELVLHASAVTLPSGATVAFVGDSGSGKSTLASYCHLQGAQIVDDDCVLLRSSGQRSSIYGGVPTLRLYPDSLNALGYDPANFAPYMNGTDKLQMCLAEGPAAAAEPGILDAIYILGAADEDPVEGAVRITAASGQAAMMSIVRNAFNLDPSDPKTIRRTFDRAAQTLTGGLPVYRLNFPRQHTLLPQVLQALLDHR